MTPSQTRAAKKQLKALEAELLKKGMSRAEPNRTDEVRAGGDEDTQPLNEMLQAIASKRNAESGRTLERTRRALAKLENQPDEYGLCEECGDEIAAPRLKAMPYVELCVGCQSNRDGPKSLPTRKRLTDYQ